jgi:hypothetical protein
MTAMTDSFEVDQRTHWFRTSSVSKPTAITIHLYTSAPGEAGGGTEASGGAYAAQNLNPLDANWTATSSTDGNTDNASAITFPAPSGANWGTITSVGLKFDTVLKLYGTLGTPKTVNDGDAAPSFAIGDLNIAFA